VADPLQHEPNLSLLALAQRDLEPRVRLSLAYAPHLARRRSPRVEDHAPGLQLRDVGVLNLPVDLHRVGLRDPVAGVHQRLRQCAIIGEQEQAFAVEVEAADGKHPATDSAE